MSKQKTIYHSFGNRLGVLRRALASDVPDRFLRNHYKKIPTPYGDEIYQEDVSLITYYFDDCRIGGGECFDTDKFYKEAEKRIKGLEVVVATTSVSLMDKEMISAQLVDESTLQNITSVSNVDDITMVGDPSEIDSLQNHEHFLVEQRKKYIKEKKANFVRLLVRLLLDSHKYRTINEANFSTELLQMIRELVLHSRNIDYKVPLEEMLEFVDWFEDNFSDLLPPEPEDDIPF